MRLINADKLRHELIIGHDLVGAKYTDMADTVEAIPIEWIRGRLQKAVDFTQNKAEGNFIDNGCVVEVVSASFTANVLLNMLEDWEKENECRGTD